MKLYLVRKKHYVIFVCDVYLSSFYLLSPVYPAHSICTLKRFILKKNDAIPNIIMSEIKIVRSDRISLGQKYSAFKG